ncbi:hypothetical protein CDAR_241551 [Caerostris darwini]|uniref:Uncharacterized protein n=1 Tax=Caerostris darwini TaxID=1538125 RepID=A0AAV4QDK2_9ARAC|nr:hypothetical protein CDAR_241551 [Caerostris darwini]
MQSMKISLFPHVSSTQRRAVLIGFVSDRARGNTIHYCDSKTASQSTLINQPLAILSAAKFRQRRIHGNPEPVGVRPNTAPNISGLSRKTGASSGRNGVCSHAIGNITSMMFVLLFRPES